MSIEIIEQRSLTRRYDYTALEVLRPHLEEISRKPGQSRRFRVIKPLPDYNEFLRRRNRRFTKTHSEIANQVFDRLNDILKDLVHWEEAVPTKFRNERVGNRLRELIPTMKEVISKLHDLKVDDGSAVYLPIDSRYESRNDHLREMRDWMIVLELHNDLDSTISSLLSECRIPSFQETKYEKYL